MLPNAPKAQTMLKRRKLFLQGDLTAKFPGKKDDNLNTEFVEGVVPKSIPKKIKQVKNAADALKAVGSIAPDAGKDVRYYLSRRAC